MDNNMQNVDEFLQFASKVKEVEEVVEATQTKPEKSAPKKAKTEETSAEDTESVPKKTSKKPAARSKTEEAEEKPKKTTRTAKSEKSETAEDKPKRSTAKKKKVEKVPVVAAKEEDEEDDETRVVEEVAEAIPEPVEEVIPAPVPMAPVPKAPSATWTCKSCGNVNKSKFCTVCGGSRAENEQAEEEVQTKPVEEVKTVPIPAPVEEIAETEADAEAQEDKEQKEIDLSGYSKEQLYAMILENKKNHEKLEAEFKRTKLLTTVLALLMILALGIGIFFVGRGLFGDSSTQTSNAGQTQIGTEIAQYDNEDGTAISSAVSLPSEILEIHSKQKTEDEELFDLYLDYNDDVVAVISIEGTILNHPAVQTPDDEQYYLRRDLNKEYNSHGVPFLSAQSQIDKPSSNTTIYGHNITKDNRDVFADLCHYDGIDYYKEHPIIKVITNNGPSDYLIFGYFLVDTAEDGYFQYDLVTDFATMEDMDDFVNKVRERSYISVPVNFSFSDKILTLSSCSNPNTEDRTCRMVVCAKQLTEADYELVDAIVASSEAHYGRVMPAFLR